MVEKLPFEMTIGKPRMPLSELTEECVNRVPVYTLGGAKAIPATLKRSITQLPSIKTLISPHESNLPPTPLSFYGEKSLQQSQNPELNNTVHVIQPVIKTVDLSRTNSFPTPYSSEPEQVQLRIPRINTRDFTKISKRLQMRLQLAYYKHKTNQSAKSFHELIKPMPINTQSKQMESKPIKKRKLALSKGEISTCSKRKLNNLDLEDQTLHTSNSSSNGDDRTKEVKNNCIETPNTTLVTPPHADCSIFCNNQTQLNELLERKQETPLNLLAAKSLINLFTSSH